MCKFKKWDIVYIYIEVIWVILRWYFIKEVDKNNILILRDDEYLRNEKQIVEKDKVLTSSEIRMLLKEQKKECARKISQIDLWLQKIKEI